LPRDNGAPPVKLYYRIGEVAELVGVEPHVLRYWESEFPTVRPQKSRSGQRVYSRRDVEKLLRVKDLLYAQRFTIAGARQRLRGAPSEAAAGPAGAADYQQQTEQHQFAERPSGAVDAIEATSVPTDRMRVAATALRSTLLAVRKDVSNLLAALGGGDGD
jgi:DNA-binding transcriptional MerR regulator